MTEYGPPNPFVKLYKYDTEVCFSCVFVPPGSVCDGRHARPCLCGAIYGTGTASHPDYTKWPNGLAPWGCLWFALGINNMQALALHFDQQAVVLFKRGHRGDVSSAGLGSGQMAEVVFMLDQGIPLYALDAHDDYDMLATLAARKERIPEKYLLGRPAGLNRQFATGLLSTDVLQLELGAPTSASSGRAGTNLSFDGNRVYTQKFFIASFPGIYENIWKRMTGGGNKNLMSVACVFFPDKSDGVNGSCAKKCNCDFNAKCAPDQVRDEHWRGNTPPWGCRWMQLWEYNVLGLAECGQQAVVVCQSAKDLDGVKGTHMGTGNAQKGEIQRMRDLGISMFTYSIEEFQDLVDLALANKPVPAERCGLAPCAAT